MSTVAQERDWSQLPGDIIASISSRLTIPDYVSFSKVCTSWNASRSMASMQMPFLFISSEDEEKYSYRLVNLSDHNIILNFSLPPSTSVKSSQDGWLINDSDGWNHGSITLHNPFTQQDLHLAPPLDNSCRRLHKFILIWPQNSLSAIAEQQLPIVVLVRDRQLEHDGWLGLRERELGIGLQQGVTYKKPDECKWEDVTWENVTFHPEFRDIYCWRGRIVGVTSNGDLFLLELNGAHSRLTKMASGGCPSGRGNRYLVDLEGDLLQIWRNYDWSGRSDCLKRTISFEVMKFDEERGTWIARNDLGGYSLFVGSSQCVALLAPQVPGLEGNMIYFTADLWRSGFRGRCFMTSCSKGDNGVFAMEDGSIKPCVPDILVPGVIDTMWVTPPPSWPQNAHFMKLLKDLYCD